MYERLRRFPVGVLTFGDAMCSSDPNYGQGMSVAALEAVVLNNLMLSGEHEIARLFSLKRVG